MTPAASTTGTSAYTGLNPHDFKAVISLSAAMRPKVIRVAIKIAMGTASARIQAILIAKSSSTTSGANPLERILSSSWIA